MKRLFQQLGAAVEGKYLAEQDEPVRVHDFSTPPEHGNLLDLRHRVRHRTCRSTLVARPYEEVLCRMSSPGSCRGVESLQTLHLCYMVGLVGLELSFNVSVSTSSECVRRSVHGDAVTAAS
ncbi:hypothetical protein HPB50_022618 [Hyalomma asiaticum]|uniref:Uncharacterized protein n=1 Tax=Hyalomma asiaticum TaxID=266040 RepID=A0ACB7S5Y2_HYAAI|nr:hypothetical protein HPB50_022618 [Hyalomma asiaticum]